MKLLKCILIENDCYKAKKTIKPQGVMVHSTGANNPNLKRYVQPVKTDSNYDSLMEKLGNNRNKNSWNRSGTGACVHGFIGKLADGSIASVQTLPWNHRGWHSGSGKKGSANNTHISFEICEDGLQDAAYFKKVYQEAVELTAMLCEEYNLDPLKDGVIICHSEGCKRGIASNHGDVMHWFPKHGKSMDDFRQDVAEEMGIKKTKPVFEGYKVKVNCDVLNVRRGPSTAYAVATQVKRNGVYTIIDEQNGWGKLKSGAGWLKLSYTKRL